MKRLTHIEIKNNIESFNYKVIGNYKNSRTPLELICDNNHKITMRYSDFQQGKRCRTCTGLVKHSQEYVNQIFLDAGCECLDKYIHCQSLMRYKCSCGNIAYIRLLNFKQGQRCQECKRGKISGPNSHMWEPDRNKIRSMRRLQQLSNSYKNRYRKKNNIKDSKLHVDHIFPIKSFYEHKIYDLDIINSEDNLQILTEQENKSKGSKYNKEEFLKYLDSKNHYIHRVMSVV